MTTAPLDPVARRVVRALYELAELDCPASAGLLARAVGLGPSDVARVLRVLEARGMASAQRARLTLLGLALAVRQPALGLSRETWSVGARPRRLASAGLARRPSLFAPAAEPAPRRRTLAG